MVPISTTLNDHERPYHTLPIWLFPMLAV